MIVDLKIYLKRGAIAGFYSANFVKPFVFFLYVTSKGLHLYVLIYFDLRKSIEIK